MGSSAVDYKHMHDKIHAVEAVRFTIQWFSTFVPSPVVRSQHAIIAPHII